MALAVTKMCIIGKSEPSKKTKKIKYSGFGGTSKISLDELQKDITMLEGWVDRDFDVKLGSVLIAEIDILGDTVLVKNLMTQEEYLNSGLV